MVKVALPSDLQPSRDSGSGSYASTRTRLRRVLFLTKFLVTAGVLLCTAPQIISLTGTAPLLLSAVDPELGGIVAFDSVTLSWWSPPEIRGLSVAANAESAIENSAETQSSELIAPDDLLTVKRIVADQPLWQILVSGGNGISLNVESARLGPIDVDRTDWLPEPLRRWIVATDSADEPESDSAWSVMLRDTTVLLRVPAEPPMAGTQIISLSGFDGEISDLAGNYLLPRLRLLVFPEQLSTGNSRIASGLMRTASADLLSDTPLLSPVNDEIFPETPDSAISSLEIRSDDVAGSSEQKLLVSLNHVDLKLLQPFLSLFGIQFGLQGQATGAVELQLTPSEFGKNVTGRVKFDLAEPGFRDHSWSADEWLRPGATVASGSFALSENGVLLDSLMIESELLSLFGNGEFPWGGGVSIRPFEMRAQCSLTGLSTGIPQTLRTLGVQPFRSGDVAVSVTTKTNQSVSGWQATASATGMRLLEPVGGQLTLPDVAVSIEGGWLDDRPVLTDIAASAEFGQLELAPEGEWWKLQGWVNPDSLRSHFSSLLQLPSLSLSEPLQLDARLKRSGDVYELGPSAITSAEFRMESPGLLITPRASFPECLAGTVSLRSHSATLRPLLFDLTGFPILSPAAEVVVRVSSLPGRELQLSALVTPAAPVRRSLFARSPEGVNRALSAQSVLEVSEARIVLSGTALESTEQWEISSGSFVLPGLSGKIMGSLQSTNSGPVGTLSCRVQYDLNRLSEQVFAAESGVQLQGAGESQVSLQLRKGPAVGSAAASHVVEGTAQIRWDSASIPGFVVGPGTADVVLRNDEIGTSPIQCSLNGGTMTITPRYDFGSGRLQLAPGSRIEQIRLSEEIGTYWLASLSPLLAESTELTGTVSARVQEFNWSTLAPMDSRASLMLNIGHLEAKPGEFAEVLLSAGQRILRGSTAESPLHRLSLELPRQDIPVTVTDGYVQHAQLQLLLNDWSLTSSGRIGFDESLALELSLPVRRSASDLQVLIPVGGTVTRPVPDLAGALRDAGVRQLQQGIQKRADEQLNRSLNQLFDRLGISQ